MILLNFHPEYSETTTYHDERPVFINDLTLADRGAVVVDDPV